MTHDDWDLIPKALAVLGPVNSATKAAESDLACISDIIPLTKKMKIEITKVDGSKIGTMKNEILKQISKYVSKLLCSYMNWFVPSKLKF